MSDVMTVNGSYRDELRDRQARLRRRWTDASQTTRTRIQVAAS